MGELELKQNQNKSQKTRIFHLNFELFKNFEDVNSMDEELDSDLEQCLKDWTDLSNEYADLEELHVKYKSKLEETLSLQKKCQSSINHQKYRLKAIQKLSSHVNVE